MDELGKTGYSPGDSAWFNFNGEEHFGTISRIYEFGGIRKIDILCPGHNFEGISIDCLYQKPPECKIHDTRKMHHDKEGKYFCPFCEEER